MQWHFAFKKSLKLKNLKNKTKIYILKIVQGHLQVNLSEKVVSFVNLCLTGCYYMYHQLKLQDNF